eukprot:GHVT01041341.1.p3 GENE.GHVT01041341.1~~GHVT01041341.1.p3  ORF type:complete len:101 (-),score=22.91 GHVT01041341.1:1215-1517(-)
MFPEFSSPSVFSLRLLCWPLALLMLCWLLPFAPACAFRRTAENVGMNLGVYNTAEEVVKGWIDSPGHRANLVGDFDLCGIAVARAPSGAFYYTQLFAATG